MLKARLMMLHYLNRSYHESFMKPSNSPKNGFCKGPIIGTYVDFMYFKTHDLCSQKHLVKVTVSLKKLRKS